MRDFVKRLKHMTLLFLLLCHLFLMKATESEWVEASEDEDEEDDEDDSEDDDNSEESNESDEDDGDEDDFEVQCVLYSLFMTRDVNILISNFWLQNKQSLVSPSSRNFYLLSLQSNYSAYFLLHLHETLLSLLVMASKHVYVIWD